MRAVTFPTKKKNMTDGCIAATALNDDDEDSLELFTSHINTYKHIEVMTLSHNKFDMMHARESAIISSL